MYKIAVLGERESVMGFAALGLAVFPVDSAEEAAEVFHRLTRQSDAYAIIYVTETYAEALHAQIEKYASSVNPAVILIPGAGGCKGAEHDLRFALQRRIDLLTDGFVEGVRGRLASGAIRGEDLHLVDAALGDFAFVKAAYHIGGLLLGIRLNKCEVSAEVQLRASFIDVLGVMGDGTVLRLTEDLVQHCDRDDAAVDQFMEHIARPNALQLIRVAHKEQLRTGTEMPKQLPCKPHIHHGGLIDDDQIGIQVPFFLLPALAST